MASLEAKTSTKQPLPVTASLTNDSLISVRTELLDTNPYQPRIEMRPAELQTLVDAIAAEGLLEPIGVKPNTDGRFTIIYGHRRVEAYRSLHTSTGQPKYLEILALVKTGMDDARLAAQGYMENVHRVDLHPVEEAVAIENILAAGIAKTTDELATLLQLPKRRVERLRRINRAPTCIKDAMRGVMVSTGVDEAGKETKELRRLDFAHALEVLRLYEFWFASKPKTALARTESLIEKALRAGWQHQKLADYVTSALEGKAADVEAEELGGAQPARPLFVASKSRWSVDLTSLRTAKKSDVDALRAAFEALLVATPTQP